MKRRRMQNKGMAIFAVLTAGAVGAGILSYFWEDIVPPRPRYVADKLCEYVIGKQQMDCVAVLAGDTFMKPGAIVDYRPSTDGSPSRVPLPVADLFGPECQVPGVDMTAFRAALKAPLPLEIEQFTYETNRALNVGAEVEVPKFKDVSLKAGPAWKNVRSIQLNSDKAWANQLDEIAARRAYRTCNILQECTDYLKSTRYRVVGTALVASGLNYKLLDKSGKVVSFDAKGKSDEFTVAVGSQADVQTSSSATIASKENRVVGVKLIPSSVFEGDQSCNELVSFQPPTGAIRVSLFGGGGKGNIGPASSVTRAINETAKIEKQGTEASECDPAFERTHSYGLAEGLVTEDGPGRLKIRYSLKAHGGHYATIGACLPGNVPVLKSGQDTTVSATVHFTATVSIALRARTDGSIKVAATDLPPSAEITVFDWRGQPVFGTGTGPSIAAVTGSLLPTDRFALKNADRRGTQEFFFKASEPGVYRVNVSFDASDSATGHSGSQSEERTASLNVSLAN